MGPRLTRRMLVQRAGLGAAGMVLGGPIAAQVTDLEGFDPLWRGPEDAIRAFFGRVTFSGEGIHLDLPQHTDSGQSVPLTLSFDGETAEDVYPRVIHIVMDGNPAPHALSAWFTPQNGRAELSTRIRLETSQTVTAVAQMSDGRYLRADRAISVAFGACGQIGTGGEDEVRAFQPETRVSVPATAARGEIVPVRALISHPMETGMRRSVSMDWIRQRIISRFGCAYNGVEVFRARPQPAVASNPYFAFYVRAEESGTFEFSWYDTIDMTFTHTAEILVT